jgi:hypothetical protein
VSVPHAAFAAGGPELVFSGRDCFIAYSPAPSPLGNRDCIVITGPARRGQIRVAISHDNLRVIWQALTGTGAALVNP